MLNVQPAINAEKPDAMRLRDGDYDGFNHP